MLPELEQYYNERFTMFNTQGWKDLVEDMQEMVKSYNNVTTINGVDEFYKRQGQLDILNWLLSLKETSETAFEELNSEETI